MTKFKVGDSVMFVKDTTIGQSEYRRQLIGKIGTVTELEYDEDGEDQYTIPSISEDYYFTDGELVLLEKVDSKSTIKRAKEIDTFFNNLTVVDLDNLLDKNGMTCDEGEKNNVDDTKSIREIYENNIGSWIGATMQDGELFFGELVDIQHNVFIVKDEMGLASMFRYEELARLVCKSDMEDFFECEDSDFYA